MSAEDTAGRAVRASPAYTPPMRYLPGWFALVALVAIAAVFAANPVSPMVGVAMPEWGNVRWVQGGPVRLADLRGRVVLLRFFTSVQCPYCSATAPALNEFEREFGPRGLTVIGIYTPKPAPRAVTDDEVRQAVAAYGFRFPVAVDADWRILRRTWLDRDPAATFTSASLLVDQDGIVRYVHPGGVYAKDSADATARADYRQLRATIEELLARR